MIAHIRTAIFAIQNFIHKHKYHGLLMLVLLVFVFVPLTAFASTTVIDWIVNNILNYLLLVILEFLGFMLYYVMKAMQLLSSYNNFIHTQIVVNGWVLVRDVVNSFCVLILLVVAFSTILQYQKYNYKQVLPRILLMAVLINFSRTIVGLIIDLGQVVMLTFVNGISPIFEGGIVETLGLEKIGKLVVATNPSVPQAGLEALDIFLSLLVAILFMFVVLFVMTWMMLMILIRVVLLWILTILSPLAFFLWAVPGGESKSSEWWRHFIQQVSIGPILMFFLWLSLATYTSGNAANQAFYKEIAGAKPPEVQNKLSGQVGNFANLVNAIVALALMAAGIKVAQDVGSYGGSMAAGWAKSSTKYIGRATFGAARTAGRLGWEGTKLTTRAGVGTVKAGVAGAGVLVGAASYLAGKGLEKIDQSANAKMGRTQITGDHILTRLGSTVAGWGVGKLNKVPEGASNWFKDGGNVMGGTVKRLFEGAKAPVISARTFFADKQEKAVDAKTKEFDRRELNKKQVTSIALNKAETTENRTAAALKGARDGSFSDEEVATLRKDLIGSLSKPLQKQWNDSINESQAIPNLRAAGKTDKQIAEMVNEGKVNFPAQAISSVDGPLLKELRSVLGNEKFEKMMVSLGDKQSQKKDSTGMSDLDRFTNILRDPGATREMKSVDTKISGRIEIAYQGDTKGMLSHLQGASLADIVKIMRQDGARTKNQKDVVAAALARALPPTTMKKMVENRDITGDDLKDYLRVLKVQKKAEIDAGKQLVKDIQDKRTEIAHQQRGWGTKSDTGKAAASIEIQKLESEIKQMQENNKPQLELVATVSKLEDFEAGRTTV